MRDFALGAHHTCALLKGGELYCLGDGSRGALGGASGTPGTPPLLLTPERAFLRVYAGGDRTCVLKQDGMIYCLGMNLRGELLTGGFGFYSSPRTLTPLSLPGAWEKIALRGLHGCALRRDHKLFCAGDNRYGQLGITPPLPPREPLPVPEPEGEEWVDVAVGSRFTCALTRTGNLYCFGDNHFGALGVGKELPYSEKPRKVPLPEGVRGFALGEEHACALGRSGSLYCWGLNRYGEVGADPEAVAIAYTPLLYQLFPDPVSQVALGSEHTCFLVDPSLKEAKSREYGNLFCFGSNRSGQLAREPGVRASVTALPVNRGIFFSRVATGERHTCALSLHGLLYCFGANPMGEISLPPSQEPRGLTPMEFPPLSSERSR